jgi:hypothetical protein
VEIRQLAQFSLKSRLASHMKWREEDVEEWIQSRASKPTFRLDQVGTSPGGKPILYTHQKDFATIDHLRWITENVKRQNVECQMRWITENFKHQMSNVCSVIVKYSFPRQGSGWKCQRIFRSLSRTATPKPEVPMTQKNLR